MAKISTFHSEFFPANRVCKELQMAGIKPIAGCKFADEYRINGCGYHYHIHYYVKTEVQAQFTPALLVPPPPFRLEQLQHVFDKIPDSFL